ncbi:acyltransferase family protein [Marivirga sp.]|uniref:acyltransferase family protein n=1 Tax=Marivirga sp. TaxID=2018662 RepID=UPI003DA7587D
MKKSRIHGMDALRGIAMWLGVVLHAVIAYQNDPRGGWPKDVMSAASMDWIYHYLHSFRMPLFFLVAGFFADFLNEKIGLKAFVLHRYKRIVLPFILSVLVIVPICGFSFAIYRNIDDLGSSFFWGEVLKGSLNWTGFYHVWFLYYLIIIYIFYISIKFLIRNFSLPSVKFSEEVFFLLTIFLIAIQYFFFDTVVEPWTGLIPRPGQILYFGYFFMLGAFINNRHDFLFQLRNLRYSYLIFGFVLLYITRTYGDELNHLLFSILISMQTMLFVLGHIAIFMDVFNRESKYLRYFSDCSYWFYLIHFPIIILLQLFLLKYEVSLYLKVSFIIFFTTLFSLITYHYFIRYSWVGTLLNGKKTKEKIIKRTLFYSSRNER